MTRVLFGAVAAVFALGACATTGAARPVKDGHGGSDDAGGAHGAGIASAPGEWRSWDGDGDASDWAPYSPIDDTPVESLPERSAVDEREDALGDDGDFAADDGNDRAQLRNHTSGTAGDSRHAGDRRATRLGARVEPEHGSAPLGNAVALGSADGGATGDVVVADANGSSQSGAAPASAHDASAKKPGSKLGRYIASSAARWVGLKSLRRISSRVPDDCSGLVRLAYWRGGLDPIAWDGQPGDNAVTAMWRRAYRLGALKKGSPRPGDLIFFRNTWDRNGDGKRNDGLTHVAIVERVDDDGTVTFIHRSGQGVNRSHLNTHLPHQKSVAGRALNEYLRRPDGTDGPRLTGELFAGYASVKAFTAESRRVASRTFASAR